MTAFDPGTPVASTASSDPPEDRLGAARQRLAVSINPHWVPGPAWRYVATIPFVLGFWVLFAAVVESDGRLWTSTIGAGLTFWGVWLVAPLYQPSRQPALREFIDALREWRAARRVAAPGSGGAGVFRRWADCWLDIFLTLRYVALFVVLIFMTVRLFI